MPLRLESLTCQHMRFVFTFPVEARSQYSAGMWRVYIPRTSIRGRGTSEKGAFASFTRAFHSAWIKGLEEARRLVRSVEYFDRP